ncbi:MAG: hypothetical protein U0797_06365 [Gemmataceae bacterium]
MSILARMSALFGPTSCIRTCHLQLKSKSMTPTSSVGPSRSTASLAIFFYQKLPQAISEACMTSTEAALALDLERADVAIDRQRLLDGRVLPAAGAEAVRPADHDQAAALVVGVRPQHLTVLLADAVGGDVRQHHAVEVRQEHGQLVASL